MSYGMAEALQTAVFQALASDAALGAVVGTAIFDEVPSGTVPSLYVTLGTETALDRSDKDASGAEHRLDVSVITDVGGFAEAKRAAAAISDVLHRANLVLARGRLVFLNFDRAVALRDTGAALRRIDLKFRARVEDDQP